MHRIKIKAKAFNGSEIYPEIDVFISFDKKDKNLPVFVYNALEEKLKQKLNRNELNFEIISKDLDILREKNVEIIWEDFIEKIVLVVDDFEEIKNNFLKRAISFYEEEKKNKAKEILENIDEKTLSNFEKDEYRLLKFMLKDKNEEEFYKEVEYFSKNPLLLKKLFFHMIKYSEDKRDEKLPIKLISLFEDKFSIRDLTDKEKSIYFYLKGRSFYYRGEFIEALKNLIKAKEYSVDEELLSDIYNTSANIFTDNLYFEEALNLAKKALDIREKLQLDEKVDNTLSLIGGIYLKQNRLNKAYEYFKKVKREDSRINNYRAKTAILRGYLNKAKEYIEKSKELDTKDEKGFIRSIEMFYLFKKGEDVLKYFEEKFVLPEKSKKVDAIVWGLVYWILAEMYKGEKKSFIYLCKGIKELIRDNYILEAYYLSLYPYKWKLNKKLIGEFENMITDFRLNSKISDYVYRHSEILKKEAKNLGLEINSDNLKEFYEKSVKKEDIFDKYNLF